MLGTKIHPWIYLMILLSVATQETGLCCNGCKWDSLQRLLDRDPVALSGFTD